jgi:hypothetical protein
LVQKHRGRGFGLLHSMWHCDCVGSRSWIDAAAPNVGGGLIFHSGAMSSGVKCWYSSNIASNTAFWDETRKTSCNGRYLWISN